MSLYQQAMERFNELFARARAHEAIEEPTAMTLATASPGGHVSARTVLLKRCDLDGFVFYTNTRSRKGRHLSENPQAALTFFWEPLYEQVLVEGGVEAVTVAEADAYFASRPRLSQASAWASQQSEPLERRAVLEERLAEIEREYAGKAIPRPPHWSGFRLRPELIEFWRGRAGRLHERDRYWAEHGEWRHALINP